MDRALNEFERARNRMAGDFRAMIADSEDLLKATAAVSEEGFNAARSTFEDKLKRARTSLADATQPVIDTTRHAAAVAGDAVRGNPWTAVGIAVAAGALIGFLAAKR